VETKKRIEKRCEGKFKVQGRTVLRKGELFFKRWECSSKSALELREEMMGKVIERKKLMINQRCTPSPRRD